MPHIPTQLSVPTGACNELLCPLIHSTDSPRLPGICSFLRSDHRARCSSAMFDSASSGTLPKLATQHPHPDALSLAHCCFSWPADSGDVARYEFMGPTQPSPLRNKTFIHLADAQAHFSQWVIQASKASAAPQQGERSFLSRDSSHPPCTSHCNSGVSHTPSRQSQRKGPLPSLQSYLFPGINIIPICSLSLLHLDYFPQFPPFSLL